MMLLRALAMLLLLTTPVVAQQAQQVPSVLVIESDRLFVETAYGRRLADELAQQAAIWQQENERIVAELVSEERSLTERRPTMTPEAFRAEAEAFDAKVQDVRRERDAKNQELQQLSAEARASFEERVQTILAAILIDRGASVLLDQRVVILSVSSINITDDAIARIDAELGDGSRE